MGSLRIRCRSKFTRNAYAVHVIRSSSILPNKGNQREASPTPGHSRYKGQRGSLHLQAPKGCESQKGELILPTRLGGLGRTVFQEVFELKRGRIQQLIQSIRRSCLIHIR